MPTKLRNNGLIVFFLVVAETLDSPHLCCKSESYFSKMSLAIVKDSKIQRYQQNSGYQQSAGCNPFTFYQVFANEFEQYYVAFSGFVFPLQGIRFKFYEDFLERQMHNFVVTKPLQRHVLTRAGFLRFLHQLF